MTTIKDVASLANVSIATVSNVLNGKNKRHGDTYNRVMDAVKQLNYTANYSAKTLRSGSVKLIGVILPSLKSPYNDILAGISHILDQEQLYIVPRFSSNDVSIERQYTEDLLSLGVSGIIAAPCSGSDQSPYWKQLSKSVHDIVLVDRDIEDLSCSKVFFNNAKVIETVARQIRSEMSAPVVDFIAYSYQFSSDCDAEEGFKRVFPDGNRIHVAARGNMIYDYLLHQWTQYTCPPSAVICTDENIAVHAKQVCIFLKWNIPIFTLGGDGWQLYDPDESIIYVHRNAYSVGEIAAKLLKSKITHSAQFEDQTIHVPMIDAKPAYTPYIKSEKELRLLLLDTVRFDSIDILTSQLQKECNAKIVIEKKPYPVLEKTIRAETAGNSCNYDMVMIASPWLQGCIEKKLLADLSDDRAFFQDRYPAFLHSSFISPYGKMFSIPLMLSMQVIYYRTDIFDDPRNQDAFFQQFGIPLGVPKTWYEYLKISEFFTENNNSKSPFKYGTSISNVNPIGLVQAFYPRQYSFRGSICDKSGAPALLSDANIRALENLAETFQFSNTRKLRRPFRDEDTFNSILTGEVPIVTGFTRKMIYDVSGAASFVRQADMPGKHSIVHAYYLGINRKSDHIDECREFFKWISSDMVSIMSMRLQTCIPTKIVISNMHLNSANPWLQQIESTVKINGMDNIIRNSTGRIVDANLVDIIIGKAIYSRLFEGEDSKTVLKRADHELEKLLWKT